MFTPGQQDKCFLCGQMGHLAADCQGNAKRKMGEFDEKGEDVSVVKKPYQVCFKILMCFTFIPVLVTMIFIITLTSSLRRFSDFCSS